MQPNRLINLNSNSNASRKMPANNMLLNSLNMPNTNTNTNMNMNIDYGNKYFDKERVKESVIKPIRIERDRNNKQILEQRLNEMETGYYTRTGETYGPEVQKCWSERNNAPYKIIIKNPEYLNKKYTKSDDLIVHKVSQSDKNRDYIDKSFKELEGNLEKHNTELKTIYSLNNETEHKKKFEYNHVYKYRMNNTSTSTSSGNNSKNHAELKEDKIKYYKDQQRKEEANKQIKDNILESLINNGIFDQAELEGFNFNSSTPSTPSITTTPTPSIITPSITSIPTPSISTTSISTPSATPTTSSNHIKPLKSHNKKEMYVSRQKR